MDATARRTSGNKGFQGKRGAAAAAVCIKPATGDGPITQRTTVGTADKLHQLPPFGIRPCSGTVTASAISHD